MAGGGGGRAETGRPRRLVDWPWVAVEVECSLYRRAGRYRLARRDEGWPPRPKRLGPERPPPSVVAIRAQGVTAVRICCEAALAQGMCLHVGEVALEPLGLSDDAVFTHIPRLRRFRCLRCGSAQVRAVPSWPDARGKREEEVTPMMPGTLPEYRMPELGEAPMGQ